MSYKSTCGSCGNVIRNKRVINVACQYCKSPNWMCSRCVQANKNMGKEAKVSLEDVLATFTCGQCVDDLEISDKIFFVK